MACGGKDSLETKEIDKASKKFADDVESGRLHSPKFGDIIFFDVWKAMAVSEDPIKADADFWHETGLVNHDFGPEVKLNPVKKLFSKLMFFVFRKMF